MVYINPRGTLRGYVCVWFELWVRCDVNWFEDTLGCGRVPVSEICGLLMIGNNHEKELISLLEILMDITKLQWVMNILSLN